RVFFASLAISMMTAIVLIILAPLLPLLFGEEYTSLRDFVRILAFSIVLTAVCSTALEALGSSGHQLQRALVLNSGAIVGGLVVALATLLAGIAGTFFATYGVGAGMAVFAWLMLL